MSVVLLNPPEAKEGTGLYGVGVDGSKPKSFNLVRTRPWGVRRDFNREFIVAEKVGRGGYSERERSGYRVLPVARGGATADTPPSEASKMQSALNAYLSVAPTRPRTISGTVAAGSSGGGGTGTVVWSEQIPVMPAMCEAIDYLISFSVNLTLGASTGAATLSPFAPYSAWANQLTLGGAPPWNLTELTPWHIDETTHRIDFDPAYPGLGGQTSSTWALPALANVLDPGPTAGDASFAIAGKWQVGGAGSLSPGATVTNATTVATTTTYTFTFWVRQILQRKRHLLVGAVPFGDPENRPYNLVQLYPLIGTLPEQSLFVNCTNATCVTTGTATVLATYRLKYIDLLPPGMATPSPMVGFGLQMVTASPSGQSSGNLFPMTHRTAMIYNAIHHILVNGQLPIRSDYFGLWDDQDQQSARWAYDSSVNSGQDYWHDYHYKYRRYPYTGVFTAELDDGVFPEVPSTTPYQARMSPDKAYAEAWGIPVTPAMTTTLRIPATVSASTPYVRIYEMGLVKVPY